MVHCATRISEIEHRMHRHIHSVHFSLCSMFVFFFLCCFLVVAARIIYLLLCSTSVVNVLVINIAIWTAPTISSWSVFFSHSIVYDIPDSLESYIRKIFCPVLRSSALWDMFSINVYCNECVQQYALNLIQNSQLLRKNCMHNFLHCLMYISIMIFEAFRTAADLCVNWNSVYSNT